MTTNTIYLLQRIQEAIEAGELLTVIYYGGHSPGAKRRILPRRLLNNTVYARDPEESTIKTYHINKMVLCNDDTDVPWANEAPTIRSRNIKIDPISYFSEWAFDIHRALWPALGVMLREYIDTDKTKLERNAAKARGVGKDELKRIAIRRMDYVVSPTPALDFHDGDMFHSKHEDEIIQVVACREFLEVHQYFNIDEITHGFHVTVSELEIWLRAGVPPSQCRISQGQSYSEIRRFNIEDPRRQDNTI